MRWIVHSEEHQSGLAESSVVWSGLSYFLSCFTFSLLLFHSDSFRPSVFFCWSTCLSFCIFFFSLSLSLSLSQRRGHATQSELSRCEIALKCFGTPCILIHFHFDLGWSWYVVYMWINVSWGRNWRSHSSPHWESHLPRGQRPNQHSIRWRWQH